MAQEKTWVKKWVYMSDGPRQVSAMHHPELKAYTIKLSHSMRDSLPEHAVFDSAEAAEDAAKTGKVKRPEGEGS